MNTPESELFKKGNVLYGLHLARPAIAKQERAVVVEGNTDVIALRQAGFEPVVASMGTALTQHQLDELWRLTRRLFLCFDSDAAGQDATLRGMELAIAKGFDVQIVTLPPGQDPADAPDGFAERLGGPRATSTTACGSSSIARSTGGRRISARARSSSAEDSPERQEALRLVADRLELPRETLAGISAGGVPAQAARPTEPPRVLEAGLRLERDALAAVTRYPSLVQSLAALSPDHFSDPLHRRLRDELVAEAQGTDEELIALRAELSARVDRDAIDERTGKQLLLRLRERKLRRELQDADLVKVTELQAHLVKLRQALAEI